MSNRFTAGIRRPLPHPARRGAISMGCGVTLGVLLLLVLGIGGCGVSRYNGIIDKHEDVEARWTVIQSQYKRRFDLIPQLVETVKGAANFEKSTITEVTEARASVGRVQLPDELPSDPAQLQAYMAAQKQLGASLGRLLLVAENYPQLRATENFRDLQTQVEGTENRIGTARTDYILSVKGFNVSIRRFPGNLIASMFGFEKLPQLEIDEGVTETPTIDFGSSDD